MDSYRGAERGQYIPFDAPYILPRYVQAGIY